jgi:hypothetical protein
MLEVVQFIKRVDPTSQRNTPKAPVSCDDANPYTHIPLLIAKQRGLPTVFTHHGALDGHYLVKRSYADTVLAKGAMERDYLVRRCGLDREQVQIGAPLRKVSPAAVRGGQTSIIFFSEDYEVSGGRVEEFYRDLVPELAKLILECRKTNAKLAAWLEGFSWRYSSCGSRAGGPCCACFKSPA